MKPANTLTRFAPQAEEEVQEPGEAKKGTYTETSGTQQNNNGADTAPH